MKNYSVFMRQWQLLNLLVTSTNGLSLEEMAHWFGVSVKTIRRDIKTLQTIPFPIERRHNPMGVKTYYFNSFCPGLTFNLTYDELFSLYIGRNLMRPLQGTLFWESLLEAFRKIKSVLKPQVIDYAERISPLFYHLDRSSFDYTEQSRMIDTILQSMEDNSVVSISYQSVTSPKAKTYCIHPYSFVYHNGFLYIVGYSCKDKEIRFWKINRLKMAKLQDERFERPEGFSAEKYMSNALCPFISEEGTVRAVLKFKETIAPHIREMAWDSFRSLETCDDGSLIVHVEMEGGKPLVLWLLGYGSDVEVISPSRLRTAVRRKAEQIVEQYTKAPR